MKRISAFILAAVCGLSFVSCGDIAETGNGDSVLTVSVFNGGYNVEWINALKVRFESENEGVTVKVIEAIGQTGRQRQITEIMSGSTKTDIYFGSNDVFMYVKDADLDVNGVEYDSYFADLSDVYNASVTGGTVGSVMYEDFEGFFNSNGKYYALPWAMAAESLVYNESFFTQNGWKVPNTTNELIELAKVIKSAKLTNEYGDAVYPFSYSLEDEYWNLLLYPWIAQYEGIEGWNNYWNGIDDEGNVNNIKMLEVEGLLRALTVMESLLKDANGFQHPSSKSKDFTDMQYRFLDKESVMTPNGDWLVSEMKESYTLSEIDAKFMKTPIISSLSEQLSYYDETMEFDKLSLGKQAEYDAMLSTIVSDVDAGKTSSTIGNAEDFARVKEARSMVTSQGNIHIAVIPSYCDQAELAKEFLKLMYSEEGAKIFADNTLGCRLPMNYSFASSEGGEFAQSVNSTVENAKWIFKYNYKNELFVKYGLRLLAPNVDGFVQLLGASNSNDYKSAATIYKESKTYFENRWETIAGEN